MAAGGERPLLDARELQLHLGGRGGGGGDARGGANALKTSRTEAFSRTARLSGTLPFGRGLRRQDFALHRGPGPRGVSKPGSGPHGFSEGLREGLELRRGAGLVEGLGVREGQLRVCSTAGEGQGRLINGDPTFTDLLQGRLLFILTGRGGGLKRK